jgi:PEP-CTERM motif
VVNLRSILLSGAMTIAFAAAGLASSVAVDLSSYANGSWCNVSGGTMYGCASLPTGQQTYNGETFNIANGPNGNAWFSSVAAGNGAGTVSLTIQTNVTNAVTVKTLMNTFWGQSGTSYDSITFQGTGGATFSENLTGNNTLRDYNNYVWTNSIVQPTTTAWTDVSQRFDEQTFVLPASFQGQTLTSITITDWGNDMFSRAFLAALTVDTLSTPNADPTTPEPGTLALVGVSLLGVGAFFRRKSA